VLQPAAGHGQPPGAATLERPGGLLADVARAQDQNVAGLQIAEDLEREIDRDAGDADLAFANRGMGAHVLAA